MPHSNLTYEFGPYRLNLSSRLLTRYGETVSLTPKATDILALLVMNAGQLVERNELLKEVWPDTFVEESNLTQNIFALRRALGDERAGPKYIETVTRRGYRFVATVRVHDGDAKNAGVAESESPAESADGDAASQRLVIAVLPFVNATGDAGVEYLAEGITDNITNNLSRVSRLRVMSRSAVFRRKQEVLDPLLIGRELSAKAVLVGKISARPVGIAIGLELVDVATGWQLWGETFECELKELLEIQDAITRQLLVNLKLTLTGEEEKRITARYTENAEAYQAYLEGRYHWSRYTRKGIEKAIGHFRQAIELDPNYALAYAAIVDCYLRLATNYLPPEDDVPKYMNGLHYDSQANSDDHSHRRIKLRFEWDWKGVERERRRANELKTDYPAPHQWYAAYRLCEQLYRESLIESALSGPLIIGPGLGSKLAAQIPSVQLTPTEEVQILCSVARDQIATGNYSAAELMLTRWAVPGKWPKLECLNGYTAADLLFTAGNLFGWIAGSQQTPHGHKHAEAFLNGSVALFEQLGIKSRSVEARVELARCYYRQGLLDIARETIATALAELPQDQLEIKTFALVVWGVIDRDSGRLSDSLVKLREAANVETAARLVTNRCCLDLATTLRDLALLEGNESYLEEARIHFLRALYESEALGHHRNVGSVENNIGFLLLNLGSYQEAEEHLLRSFRVFEALSDSVRGAQVNDTLARLYVDTQQLSSAQKLINQAVETLERTDSEAILAEALTTKGIVHCKLNKYTDARRSFEAAYKVAQRCGDSQGAVRALLALLEEMADGLEMREALGVADHVRNLLSTSPQPQFMNRLEKAIAQITANRVTK